jgi:hypothetical protein
MAEPLLAELRTSSAERARLDRGAAVEVRNRFDGRWSRGFEVVDASDHGYRVRRLSDGRELPVHFGFDDVRPRRALPFAAWRG